MNPSFLVSVPEEWLNMCTPIDTTDMRDLFRNIPIVLESMGIDFETTPIIKKMIDTNGVFLSHHTCFKDKNVWNIKKGYLQNYFYFDRTGYSGWAEMANSKELFIKSQEVNFEDAQQFFTKLTSTYKRVGSSKIKQSHDSFNITEPYVFVAGQRPHDTVSKWAYIPTIDLMKEVAEAFCGTKYKVVIKVHPLELSKIDTQYNFLKNKNNVIVTNASIHKIIPNASGIYTVNSGVGFESLLYQKQVFVSGHCDYHWVTNTVRTSEDIRNSFSRLEQTVDKTTIIKFIYYMLTEYFIKTNDVEAIQKKIELAIREYS